MTESPHRRGSEAEAVEYEFVFVVDGVSVDDVDAVGIVLAEFDGLLTRHKNRHLLDVAEFGEDAIEAAHCLVARLRRALPAMRLLWLDPEPVGVGDAAEQPFCGPEVTARRSPVWRRPEAGAWLNWIGAGGAPAAPLREEALLIDLMLPQWQRSGDDQSDQP